MKSIVFLLLINVLMPAMAQDTVNRTDENGVKQGYWEKFYPDGKIEYKGYFVNDLPVGRFLRFWENGSCKAEFIYDNQSIVVQARLFYRDSSLAAEGKYISKNKDGLWRYYSYYEKKLSIEESYSMGKREGVSKKYYPSGNLMEELSWKNNTKDGIWKQYYDNKKIRLEAIFKNGTMSGSFNRYYPDGTLEVSGLYVNGLLHGPWIYRNEKGEVVKKILYNNGKPADIAKYEKEEDEFFKNIDSMNGKLSDPIEADFLR